MCVVAGIGASLAGSLGGAAISGAMSGGGSGGGTSPYTYVPYNQPGMDTNFNNYYNQYGNTLGAYYGNVNPYATSQLYGQLNNPYNNNYQQGSQLQQNAYYGAGAGATGAMNADYGLGSQLANASNNWGANGQVLQQLQQQSADAANAQSYLRGTQNSPYGAATAANAIDQTNLAYAQQQAATQAQLAGAATNAYGAGSYQGGLAGQYYGTGAAAPYQANQNIYNNQNQALSNYYGQIQPYLSGLNQLQGNALQYLGYGNTANNTALSGQAQQNSLISQGASAGANLGQSLYNAYNNSGGGGGYNFTSPYTGLNTGNAGNYDYYGSGNYYAGGLGY